MQKINQIYMHVDFMFHLPLGTEQNVSFRYCLISILIVETFSSVERKYFFHIEYI